MTRATSNRDDKDSESSESTRPEENIRQQAVKPKKHVFKILL